MMNVFMFLLCFVVFGNAQAQQTDRSEGWKNISLSAGELRSNTLLQEQILDLAEPAVADSILKGRRQYHRVPIVGWFIRFAGYNWRRVLPVKQKFVGTAIREFSKADKEEYTEADVNTNLVPHLQRYQEFSYQAYLKQLTHPKGRRKRNTSVAPYLPPAGQDPVKYDIHCELTPPRAFRESMGQMVYPCMNGSNYANHPHFGYRWPALGVYGAVVSDCNHGCDPEIHPYEWLYWLNLNPAKDGRKGLEWVVSLSLEGSARFKRWSRSPKTGSIAIPFVFEDGKSDRIIEITHLHCSRFHPEVLEKSGPEMSSRSGFQFEGNLTGLLKDGERKAEFKISQNTSIRNLGLRWWLSEVKYDESGKRWSGYFHLATSVSEVYAARLYFH